MCRCPGREYSPGKRADIWAQIVTFTEIAALAVSVEIIVTVLKQRAPGMTLNRMPLFVWATAGHVLHGDLRHAVRHAVQLHADHGPAGRHAVLQHGRRRRCAAVAAHVLVLRPSRGLHHLPAGDRVRFRRSSPTFARRPIFGYTALVLALFATAFLGFGLWVHHMFATGLPQLGNSFFTAASMTDRDTQRHPDLLLDRDAVGRQAALRHAAAVRHRLHRRLRPRRPDRGDAGVGAARPAGPRHLFRGGALPLRADRRRGVPAARAPSITGSPR